MCRASGIAQVAPVEVAAPASSSRGRCGLAACRLSDVIPGRTASGGNGRPVGEVDNVGVVSIAADAHVGPDELLARRYTSSNPSKTCGERSSVTITRQ